MKKNFFSYLILVIQGVCILLVYFYFKSLINQNEINSTEAFIYNLFCSFLLIISIGMSYLANKQKALRLFKLFTIIILLIHIVLFSFYHLKLSPLPYQFRLTLVNRTNKLLNVKLAGCMDVNVDNLQVDEEREIIIPLFEGCSIDLINKTDTVSIGHSFTNSYGYKKVYYIEMQSGK